MDVSEILSLARDQSHTNTTQFPDTQLIKYLNIVKNNFWSYLITAKNENYDWDIFTSTTVVDQDEYVLPLIASDTAGVKKVSSVSINYDGKTYDDGSLQYVKATPRSLGSLTRNWNYYINNQDKEFPIYHISDNSFFIAPQPSTAIVDGVQLKGIKKIPDYLTTSLEATLVIPIDYHDILIQGILPYIYKAKGQNQESSSEKQEYIRQRDQAVKELGERNIEPLYMDYPIQREAPSDTLTVTLN